MCRQHFSGRSKSGATVGQASFMCGQPPTAFTVRSSSCSRRSPQIWQYGKSGSFSTHLCGRGEVRSQIFIAAMSFGVCSAALKGTSYSVSSKAPLARRTYSIIVINYKITLKIKNKIHLQQTMNKLVQCACLLRIGIHQVREKCKHLTNEVFSRPFSGKCQFVWN